MTGEGFVDEQSFRGKAVGGVVELAAEAGVAVLVVTGEVLEGVDVAGRGVECISLVERFGRERAMADPTGCVRDAVADVLTAS